jgi:hypothetical protein
MKKFYFLLLALITAFTAGADNAALKKQIVGSYSGPTGIYEYMSNSSGVQTTVNYTETSPLVIEALGGDSVVVKNILGTELEGYGDIQFIGTVVADDSSEGYVGYIEFQPQACGTAQYYGSSYNVTAATWGYYDSSNKWVSPSAPTEAFYYYIKSDYTIYEDYWGLWFEYPGYTGYYLMAYGCYASFYPVFTKIPASTVLKNKIVGSYTGPTGVYEYMSNSNGVQTTVNYTETSPLVIEALSGDSVVVKNILGTELGGYGNVQFVGKVVADDSSEGYVGYIEFQPHACGTAQYYGSTFDVTAASWGYYDSSNKWISPTGPTEAFYYYITSNYTIYEDYWALWFEYPGYTGYYTMAYGCYASFYPVFTKFTSSTATAIKTVKAKDEALDPNAPVEYYNLQGVRVSNPENGIYIRRQGNKATKVVIK